MKLPNTAHTAQPWRIHEVAPDFRLEDVWSVPAPGGPADFQRAVRWFASLDPSAGGDATTRTLFAIRWKLGELFGWDAPGAGVEARLPSLRDRLPADLLAAPTGPQFEALPFNSLYLLEDEWAAEICNATMHGILHLGLVRNRRDGYRAQLAVLVKPNGVFGYAYMAAIRPFRHHIVYPALTRELEQASRRSASPVATRGSSSDMPRGRRRPGSASRARTPRL